MKAKKDVRKTLPKSASLGDQCPINHCRKDLALKKSDDGKVYLKCKRHPNVKRLANRSEVIFYNQAVKRQEILNMDIALMD
ncbi:hypothetical protein A3B57_03075 [Microgenomates group bacterium RIFCSPLOWO2_01_FULL_47_10]|nr:MAG: hypothetical protein A3B57_03075 [Microgenomates group bacterium RIFCSPLOWO2_01_FULL_47_10]